MAAKEMLRNVKNLDLGLSNPKFMEKIMKPVSTEPNDWLNKAVFPEAKILADISSLVYEDTFDLPVGWELLTTACNKKDGYFGAACWNPDLRQVVIAHRGTSCWKAVKADVKGIIGNQYTSQISSACSFAALVVEELRESKIRVTFTGHSLGAWLAQITTFTTEYLTRKGDGFGTRDNTKDSYIYPSGYICGGKRDNTKDIEYHAHTVVFDSPGCKKMLEKLAGDYYPRYDHGNIAELEINALDITIYLSAPNQVNTCGGHVGTLFRLIFKQPKSKTRWVLKDLKEGLEYNKATHSIKNLCEAMSDASILINAKEILDWPLVIWTETGGGHYIAQIFHAIGDKLSSRPGVEYTNFHTNYSQIDSQYTIQLSKEIEINGDTIRYRLREVDAKASRTNVFTRNELKFLNELRTFFYNKLNLDILQAFLKESRVNFEWTEKDFEIKEHIIKCNSKEMLQEVVNRTKQLCFWLPKIFDAMGVQVSKTPTWHSAMYRMKSKDYCSLMQKEGALAVSYTDYLDLKMFLQSEKCVLHVTASTTGEASLKPMTVCYNILSQQRENCTYLNYAYLQHMQDEGFDIVAIFKNKSFIDETCLVIDCSEENELSKMKLIRLRGMLDHCKSIGVQSKKIILITNDENSSKMISISLQDYAGIWKEIEMRQPNWKDLTEESRNKLLAKKMFRFQEQGTRTSLAELMIDPENVPNAMLDGIIDFETRHEGGEINIGKKPLCMSDLPAAYYQPREKISIMNLLHVLRNSSATDTLFMIKGVDKLGSVEVKTVIMELEEAKRIEKDTGVDEASSLEQFKILCNNNPDKTIHWVEIMATEVGSPQYAQWHMLYDGKFYFQRKINYRKKIILSREIKNKLMENTSSDSFMFSGIAREEDLMEMLTITDAAERKTFSDNVTNGKIGLGSSTEKQNTFDNTHWLEVERSANEQQQHNIVWTRSTGSLDVLRKYIDKDKSEVTPMNETNFSELIHQRRLVIIADEPGMGKSTTLTSMSDQLVKTNAWVVRVDLGNCQQAISNLPPNSSTYSLGDAVDFISPVEKTSWSSKFTNILLRYALANSTRKPVVLLFDGFDEIKEDNAKVLNVLKVLQSKSHPKTTICITTREYQKKTLENGLSVFASSFKAVESNEQQHFLKAFWQVRRSLLDSRSTEKEFIEAFAKELLAEARNILGFGIDSFVGVPLQLRMLAEVFQQELERSIVSKDLNNIKLKSTVDIYHRFVRAKFEIYLKEKRGLSIGSDPLLNDLVIDALVEKHRTLAFFFLCPNEYLQFTGGTNLPISGKYEKLKTLFLRIGLIQKHDGWNHSGHHIIHQCFAGYLMADFLSKKGYNMNPNQLGLQFVHLSLAEYFTADFLMERLKQLEHNTSYQGNFHLVDFLLKRIFLEPKFKVVRTFFNDLLSENDSLSLTDCKSTYHRDDEGRTALHILANENHVHIAKFLLHNVVTDEDLLNVPNKLGDTALGMAVKVGSFDFLKMLLWRETNFKVKNKCGLTTLHLAVLNKRLHQSVKNKLSIISGIPVEYGKRRFISPSMYRYEEFKRHAIRRVIQQFRDKHEVIYADICANIDTQDSRQSTPLHWAAVMGHEVFVEMLLFLRADVNARDDRGRTALHNIALAHAHACPTANGDAFKTLAQMEFNSSLLHLGLLPFELATFDSYKEIVKMLLKCGADVNARDKSGNTVLQHAVWVTGDSVAFFQLLVKHKADINAQDKNGMTILHDQAKRGNVDGVRLLMDNGANPKVVDKSGKTPLMLAKENSDIPEKERKQIQDQLQRLLKKKKKKVKPETGHNRGGSSTSTRGGGRLRRRNAGGSGGRGPPA